MEKKSQHQKRFLEAPLVQQADGELKNTNNQYTILNS